MTEKNKNVDPAKEQTKPNPSKCAKIASLMGLLVFGIYIPVFGLFFIIFAWTGIILGIVALCRLTPEEKAQSFMLSGSTKNCALVGIITPPLLTAVNIGLALLIK